MALTVAPAEGFDSLASLTEAASYMAKFGRSWPVTEGEQEIALRNATQYICNFYSVGAQHLDPVAQGIKDACCEAAWRAADGSLFVDVDPQAVTEESVGPITTKYAVPIGGCQKRFGVIDALMRGFTGGLVGQVRLVRA